MTIGQILGEFVAALLIGDREGARRCVTRADQLGFGPDTLIAELFWPAYLQIDQDFRCEKIPRLRFNYASRLLRVLVDQNASRMSLARSNALTILMFCGPCEIDELAAQMASDVLEAAGYEVVFGGSEVANDEIIAEVQTNKPAALVIVSSGPKELPVIRELLDRLHDNGSASDTRIITSSGVFSRAPGLGEEMGAHLSATDPFELVDAITSQIPNGLAETKPRRRRRYVA